MLEPGSHRMRADLGRGMLSRLASVSLSIRTKVIGGFAVVMVLLMIMVAMASRGMSIVETDFNAYRGATTESLMAGRAMQEFLLTRMNAALFRLNNEPIYARQVNAHINSLYVMKNEWLESSANADTASRLAELEELLVAYQSAFRSLMELQDQSNVQVENFGTTGRETRVMLTEFSDRMAASSAHWAARGADVQQHLLLARYYGERFLLSNDPADSERALSEIDLAQSRFMPVLRGVQFPQERAPLESIDQGLNVLEGQVVAMTDTINARNALVQNDLNRLAPELISGYRTILDEAESVRGEVGPRTTAKISAVSNQTLAIGVAALLIGAIAALLLSRTISSSIRRAVTQMTQLASGNNDIDISGTERSDEIGDMARALLVFKENGEEKVRLEARQAEAAQRSEAEKRSAMNAMADDFEASVNEVVEALSGAASDLVDLSQTMNATISRAGERSTAVSAASEQAAGNVETVATASEEMTASLAEVSQRVAESASMANDAAQSAGQTSDTVGKLATSAQTIGDVISMINDIAAQTNLLALNATIEAARAGEAGRGFAVVASEVKSLATQTATATDEISAQITGMQTDTDAVVQAIQEIGGMISDLNDTSSSIAVAVEEQHSATQEIARNTQQAADGTREVNANIADVSLSVQETGTAAREVLSASNQLAGEADKLRQRVADFLDGVRAA